MGLCAILTISAMVSERNETGGDDRVTYIAIEEAQAPFVLTFDVGTSSVRALAYDAQARAITGFAAQVAYEMTTTPDGGVFCDADALVARTASVIDQVLKRAGSHTDKIAAVASDTFWHNVIGVDADGHAITPLYTWADTRNARAATTLRQRLDEEGIHRRTGCYLHTMYLPAKFAWLAETQAEVTRRVHYWMSFAEYFALQCFGQRACSLSMASGTGLLNLNDRTWDAALLRELPVSAEQLSPLVDIDQPLQGLVPDYARRWPALAGVPWYPSLGDGAASNLGSGGTNPRRIAVNAGTSTAMRVVVDSDTVHVPDGLWAYRVDGRHPIVGGAESNGGNVWAWIKERFRIDDDAMTAREIAAVPPDGHGLTILPFLAGERSPNYKADARATLSGLALDTTAAEISRAWLEAMTYRLVLIHRLIARGYPQAQEIIVSGTGFLKNPVWIQITADALGLPVDVSDEAEATSRGSALIALEQLHAIPGWDALPVSTARTVEPDMAAHAIYQRAIDRQEALYDVLLRHRS